MSSPLVSLGLPVFNGEAYVREAIDAVLAQRFPDFELIISDNASNDDTPSICQEYVEADRRVRYHRNEQNLGIAPNCRRVFEHSTGKYFKWVVADDVCGPDYLAECVDVLEQQGDDVILAYPQTTLIDSSGDELEAYEDRLDLRNLETPSARLRHVLQNCRLCHAALGLIRATSLRKTPVLGSYQSSDVVLLSELAMLGKFWEIPKPLYFRRMHSRSSFQCSRSRHSYHLTMDASNSLRFVMPRTKQCVEIVRSIRRSVSSFAERQKCLYALLSIWGPAYWRVVAGEFKLSAREIFNGRSGSHHTSPET